MNANNMDRLICPVCYHIPGKEVCQCRDGHILCDQCILKLDECPQCWESFRGMERCRNRFMEETLDGLELDCPFTAKRCETKKMKRDELAKHRSSCKFGKVVPLCKFLKLDHPCNFKVNIGNLKVVKAHLETHDEIEKRGEMPVQRIGSFFVPVQTVFVYPFLLKFEDYRDNILFVVKQKDDFVSWMFFDLGENHWNGPHMKIQLWSDETPKVSWTLPVYPVIEAEEHFKNPMVKTFIPYLKQIREQKVDNEEEKDDYVINFKLIMDE